MIRTIRSWLHPGRKSALAWGLVVVLHGARLDAQEEAASPGPEAAIRALESARAEALLHADTTALSRMVADEFVEVSRLGTLRTKADNLREIGSGALKLTSVRYDSVCITWE